MLLMFTGPTVWESYQHPRTVRPTARLTFRVRTTKLGDESIRSKLVQILGEIHFTLERLVKI